ncbi:hypothetical protein DM860_011098 [Cuscuta australis]|uniref:3-ketoacyl-CoA synthase n=1 Tax=Cuscuta australis TaxID=267555 RepID=A0A328E2F6_9ASTE|nr:hypothetical protein DM860_011098 [Cuscuta australis]
MAEESLSGGDFNVVWERLRSSVVEFVKLCLLLLFFFVLINNNIYSNYYYPNHHELVAAVTSCLLILLLLWVVRGRRRRTEMYVVDYVCYEPPSCFRMPFSLFREHLHLAGIFDQKSVDFMDKILRLSGLSEETHLPPALHYIPPRSDHAGAMEEARTVLFPIFEQLLSGNGLSPRDVDILVVNCSGFCPDPSLASMVVSRFGMRDDVRCFNLTGMGCSANTVAVDMVRNMMMAASSRPRRRTYNAVILSTEILSTGWYPGKERPFMVLNSIFRMGGAAVLMSNKREAKKTAKYKLIWTLRTQGAFDDRRYSAAYREEDSEGITGVRLNGDVLYVAGETLQSHIPILGARFLPYTEILLFLASTLKKKFLDKSAEIYVPNFKLAIQHFCFPATGKSVVRETAKRLKLGEEDMEPALMAVYRFGNQSSASLWYELAYLEAKNRVKKGDRVWQLGMGTGPKCNSVVLQCCRPISGETTRNNPWADCIHKYPVTIP